MRRRSTPTGSSATRLTTHTWIPFGGGVRRCIGAAFANMEMNVTLRTLLREFEFGTTYAPGERVHSRGVATAPGAAAGPWCTRRQVPRTSGHDAAGVGMTRARGGFVDVGRGIRLCYDQIGDADDPPIVLIAGLGQQLHSWPEEFAEALAGRGYRVTRLDNRDVGRSTHMNFPAAEAVAILRGGNHPAIPPR